MQSSWSKGISETNLKLKIPCSKWMHQPVTSQVDACTSQAYACMYCMHCPMTSKANACSYCMGSVVSISSQIYLSSPATLAEMMALNIDISLNRLINGIHHLSCCHCSVSGFGKKYWQYSKKWENTHLVSDQTSQKTILNRFLSCHRKW